MEDATGLGITSTPAGTLADLLKAENSVQVVTAEGNQEGGADPNQQQPPAVIEDAGAQKTQAELDAEAAAALESGNPEGGSVEQPPAVVPPTVNPWEKFSEESGIKVNSKEDFEAYLARERETARNEAISANPRVSPIVQALNELIGDTTGKEPTEVIGMLKDVISNATTDYAAIASNDPEAIIQAGMLDGNSYMTEESVKIAIEDMKYSLIQQGQSKDLEDEDLEKFVSDRMKIKALDYVPKLKSKQVDLAAKASELAAKAPAQVDSPQNQKAQYDAYIAGMNEVLGNTKSLSIGGEAGDWNLSMWDGENIKEEYHPLLERLAESPGSFFQQYLNPDGTPNVAKILETELKLHELPKMVSTKTKEAVVDGKTEMLRGMRNPGTAAPTAAPVTTKMSEEEEAVAIAKSLSR